MLLTFKWDDNKNRTNQRKHGVSFEEAKTVFFDANACVIADPDHSHSEERFVILGMSQQSRLLIVCHCYRENDQVVRIISSRKATKKEGIMYMRVKK